MSGPPSDQEAGFDPLGGELPGDKVAALGEQSQLDFDLAFYDAVLRRSPNCLDVLRCQGELLTRKGLHERALVIDRRLVLLLPEEPVVRYNLACSLALNGEPGEAIDELRNALELGYEDLDFLQTDADLDSLRDDPRYQALMRELLSSVGSDLTGDDRGEEAGASF
ncbi:MAG TPA: hypothetical protein VHZ24_00845 [Pirellulales bacterium]|jgi:predicted Zn-dependent protease|nr:hypothetical protein [Pirellulales bacterium]